VKRVLEHGHALRAAPEIRISGIGKKFAGVSVLRDVSFSIAPGEIHGLLGENGAGKSTLLGILGGALVADDGQILFDGERARLGTPRDAIRQGVSLISQELALVRHRTVLENVFLGRWSHRVSVATKRRDRQLFDQLCSRIGYKPDPSVPVSQLSLGEAQQVEVLKALARGSRILCLDEPTAALSETESEQLLAVLQNLADGGTTIVLVSHFLEEVLSLADRITVLRDGNQIVTEDAAEHTPKSLVKLMIGRDVSLLAKRPNPTDSNAPVILKTSGLTNTRISNISLTVHRGEILGLAGLVGSGRSEILRAIAGVDRVMAGQVEILTSPTKRNSIRSAIKRGVAFVPESRKEQGLVLSSDASKNIALPTLYLRQFLGFVRHSAEEYAIERIVKLVDIRGQIHGQSVTSLSGGNQQKVMFGKWLIQPPIVFLIDEPTRGVDIAAKAKIHDLIIELAAAGTAVIIASSELEEVMTLSHRINVVNRGRIVA